MPYTRTGGPRRTPRVRRETVSNFETEVHSLPLDETEVQGVFELLSVRAVHWYACHLPKVKLQKLKSEKHAFGLPVERRKEGSQGL